MTYRLPEDRVMDAAIRREMANVNRAWVIHGRWMFVWGMLAGAVLMLAVGCGAPPKCHSGYYYTKYTAAWDEHGSTCYSRDKHGTCTFSVPYTVHHPATCDARWICKVNCGDVDAGNREAHIEHAALQTEPVVDPLCKR